MLSFDPEYYEIIYPEYKKSYGLPLLHYMREGWKNGANPSPLFNTAFYLSSCEDALKSGESPLEHYENVGKSKGFACFPEKVKGEAPEWLYRHLVDIGYYLAVKAGIFDQEYYQKAYPDSAAFASPLAHYRNIGWKEGRKPSKYFEPKAWTGVGNAGAPACDPVLLAVGGSKWDLNKIRCLVDGSFKREVIRAGLFDPEYYSMINPEFAEDKKDGFLHYMLLGWRQGQNPSSKFNTRYYAQQHTCNEEENPFWHYVGIGLKKGLPALPMFENFASLPEYIQEHIGNIAGYWLKKTDLFDGSWYLAEYPDVHSLGINPLDHYRKFGFRENRNPNRYINCRKYLKDYLNNNNNQCAIWHYLIHGRDKGNIIFCDESLNALMKENLLLLDAMQSMQLEIQKYRAKVNYYENMFNMRQINKNN